MTTFEECFSRVINAEGGFQNDRNDRGNWTGGSIGSGELRGTKFGISAMSYPHLDIQNLTLDQARLVYKKDWWEKLNLHRFSKAVSFQIFDSAVNHGPSAAIRMVQRAVGVLADGIVGEKTISAIRKIDPDDFVLKFLAERIEFFTKVSTFSIYGRGWMNRVAENLRIAAEDN
jgi:lysozyme family protein